MDYKILVVKNCYSKKIDLTKYLIDWFKKYTPLKITIDEISTNFDVTPITVGNSTYSGIICNKEILPKLRTVIPENKYNCVVLYADNLTGGIRISVCNGENRTGFLYPNTELIQLRKISDNGKEANHELFHAFFAKANRLGIQIEDTLDTYLNDSNTVIDNIIDTNREISLLKLSPYWSSICSLGTVSPVIKETIKYKYFTEKEIVGLKPELVSLLDKMRGECGFPFKINSGYRSVAQNASLSDAVSDSAHLSGLAVDLSINDSFKRFKLVQIALSNGIKRIGVGSTFIHLDISKTLPQEVMWDY